MPSDAWTIIGTGITHAVLNVGSFSPRHSSAVERNCSMAVEVPQSASARGVAVF